ncbi:hypothetical protein GCM10008014_08600 [Paenibacillus silvae]|uniref:DUF7167 domain-containing protein n=1 Tax=Paenibacillus silvae TaxID=1325358 RepID=A0ABQ1Z322_9BACL|nr:hypothetical protein [Paenibacillus silvae]GGH46137.1 hypothetical protein GCM10008014_08600 [Paenibacillus silvae]
MKDQENGVLTVDWEMSIGFPGARRQGSVDIELSELEGKTADEREEIIYAAIWEDAMQFVDVYPTNLVKEEE